MPFDSPMMKQYNRLKAKHEGALLFFRLGDFYEMFGDDAILASKELDLTLTSRDRGVENPDERVPMCGVPHHSSEAYIQRLVAKGYKIAICEQMEDPALAKGLVRRDVIRVVTPGTLTEPDMLDEGAPNWLCALNSDENGFYLARADISTGKASLSRYALSELPRLKNELGAQPPSEILCSESVRENRTLCKYIEELIKPQFRQDLFERDIEGGKSAQNALIAYVSQTRMAQSDELTFEGENSSEYMELDGAAIRGLELFGSFSTGDKKGGLMHVLDRTKTPMGRRMLRLWLLRPLKNPVQILRRLDSVNALKQETIVRGNVRAALKNIGDLERLTRKIAYGGGNARDLTALAGYLEAAGALIPHIKDLNTALLGEIATLDPLDDLRAEIFETIVEEPPVSTRDGGIIRPGRDAEIDRLRSLDEGGSQAVADLEAKEKEKTGLKLRIGYTRAFGYYIELPRSKAEAVPPYFIRRQTLTNAERYVTEELKTLEHDILQAREKRAEREFELFQYLCDKVAAAANRICETAEKIAVLDVLSSNAETAAANNYVMPSVSADGVISIADGRHPVVEATRRGEHFVPNDVLLGTSDKRVMIITGPNMAGKSTYMRMTALIVIMAQAGSFVPARNAEIGIVDRIFTRIGAGDDISGGKSTFMVEMTEASEILKYATKSSLILLDEIGRGTSTYDGVAIARAILEYCADKKKIGARTMFSTHYHEIAEAETETDGVFCCAMTAKKQGEKITFLHKVTAGAVRDSYGIDVAKLAGLPESVVRRAREVMTSLGGAPDKKDAQPALTADPQVTFESVAQQNIADTIRSLSPDTLSPIEALKLIYKFKIDLQ